MQKNLYRKLSLLFIKYTPGIMALSCSLKIFILGLGISKLFTTNIIVNIINLTIDVFIVLGVYFLGKTFNYCWKHQSLCRAALIGYLNYGIFIIFKPSSGVFLLLTVAYVALILIMGAVYYEYK